MTQNYGLPKVVNVPTMPHVHPAKDYFYCPAIRFHNVYGRVEDVETSVNELLELGWKLHGTPFAYKDGIIQSMVFLPALPSDLDIITESGDGC